MDLEVRDIKYKKVLMGDRWKSLDGMECGEFLGVARSFWLIDNEDMGILVL